MQPMPLPFRLCSALAAACLLAGACHAQPAPAEPPFTPPERFEMLSWVPPHSDWKIRVACTVADSTVTCTGSTRNPDFTFDQRGRLEGRTFHYETTAVYSGVGAATCRLQIEYRNTGRTVLGADGRHAFTNAQGTGRLVSATSGCGEQPATLTLQPAQGIGTWQALSANTGAGFGDRQLRAMIWNRIDISDGEKARACFAEAMGKLAEPRNADMLERLTRAALQQHMIDVATEMAAADDFAANWQDAAKRLLPSTEAKDVAMDRIIRYLPGPLRTLYEVGDKAHGVSTGINDRVALPLMQGKLYEQYLGVKLETPGNGHEQNVAEAGARTGVWTKLVSDFSPRFPGASEAARVRAMSRWIGTRFDFIQKVRDTAANRTTLLADAWRETGPDIARIRMTVLDCIAR